MLSILKKKLMFKLRVWKRLFDCVDDVKFFVYECGFVSDIFFLF